ncbi:DUF2795 domain-containing protein [Nocardia sp. NPDC058666]|uniref:DUF2795 domain-containing protein n=1 Tax=unclassified Nocardia TaxID=2637762 RepID=UPI0036559693
MAQSTPIQVEKYLGGVNYPVGRDTLVATAEQHSAPGPVISALQSLPDEQFASPIQVSEAIG